MTSAGLVILAMLVVGCGAPAIAPPSIASAPTTSASQAPVVTPTTTHTFAVTPNPAQLITDHVTQSVTELMSLSGNDAINTWIDRENAWLAVYPNLPILYDYNVAIVDAMVIGLDPDRTLAPKALEIIQVARRIPGVHLP